MAFVGREWSISPTQISHNYSPTSPANGDLIQTVPSHSEL